MTTIGTGLTEVTIPSLSDPANIQDAFKLYHWGSTTTTGSPTATSIAYKISALSGRIDNIISTETLDLTGDNSTDLNSLLATNNYKKLDTPPSGKNYPVVTSSTFIGPGFLSVIRTTKNNYDYVLQTYHMYDILQTTGIDGQTTATFWRSAKITNGTPAWGLWQQGTTSAALNTLKGTVDGKQSTITGAASTITSLDLTVSRALVSSVNGKVEVSSVTASELGYLSGVTSGIQGQLTGKAASTHTHGSITTDGKLSIANAMVKTDSLGAITTLAPGTTSQYLRGDGIWAALPAGTTYTAGTGITISGSTISNAGVTSVNGQVGAVTVSAGTTYTGGTGISVSGSTITNTGVTSFNGSTGAVSVSIPKVVGGTASVVMNGTSRGSGTVTISGLNSISGISLTSSNPAINLSVLSISGTTVSMEAGHIDGTSSSATITVYYVAVGT